MKNPKFVVILESEFELTVRDFTDEDRAIAEYETFRGYLAEGGCRGNVTIARVLFHTTDARERVREGIDQ